MGGSFIVGFLKKGKRRMREEESGGGGKIERKSK
jgi:hypothetical protein